MRSTVIAMVVVFILSLCVCVSSSVLISHVAVEIDGMRMKVLEKIDAGDLEGAHEQLTQLAEMWSRHESWLEMLTSHEDLHTVSQLIIEANANYEVGDRDDFMRSIALLGYAIEHVYKEEMLKLSNVI